MTLYLPGPVVNRQEWCSEPSPWLAAGWGSPTRCWHWAQWSSLRGSAVSATNLTVLLNGTCWHLIAPWKCPVPELPFSTENTESTYMKPFEVKCRKTFKEEASQGQKHYFLMLNFKLVNLPGLKAEAVTRSWWWCKLQQILSITPLLSIPALCTISLLPNTGTKHHNCQQKHSSFFSCSVHVSGKAQLVTELLE